jgi:uncharacterized membrane protein YoaK (UPF0700 family)
VTDIGIELGKLIYWNKNKNELHQQSEVGANLQKLRLHASLVLAFFVGGVLGAFGFKYFGFISTLPIAIALVILSVAPNLKKR